MKNLKNFAILMMAVVMITGCSKDEKDGGIDNDPVAVKFSSSIASLTRASGTTWDDEDKIGVFMIPKGSTNSDDAIAQNHLFTNSTTGENGTFTTAVGDEIYFPEDGSKVDFFTYYPYTNDVAVDYLWMIENISIEDQNDPAAIDLMVANTSITTPGGYDKTDRSVGLVFKHLLSKLIIETKPGNGVTQADLDEMTVTIKGMLTEYTFVPFLHFLYEDIDMSIEMTNVGDIVPRTVINGKQYDAILIPWTEEYGGSSDWSVEFDLGAIGVSVLKLPADTQLESGKEHIWTVTINAEEGDGAVLINASIMDWAVGDGYVGETE